MNKKLYDNIYMIFVIYVIACVSIIAFIVWGYANIYYTPWDTYFRSSIGGILGGIGALLAVYITVNSNIYIQERNRKEADLRLKEEIQKRELGEKKILVEKLRRDICEYIVHIADYHYDQNVVENIHNISDTTRNNKLVANALYFSLLSTFDDLENAANLVRIMKKIHNNAGRMINGDMNWIDAESINFMEAFADFSKCFVADNIKTWS
ncbi:MAG: hypothetical protein KBS54_01680 [Synergistaceae bacterium]|nr:hypothetical protein [Candidatus Equadaptatus faecalis]